MEFGGCVASDGCVALDGCVVLDSCVVLDGCVGLGGCVLTRAEGSVPGALVEAIAVSFSSRPLPVDVALASNVVTGDTPPVAVVEIRVVAFVVIPVVVVVDMNVVSTASGGVF